MSKITDNLETLLAQGPDSAVLRFSLGSAHIDQEPALAIEHLERAIEFNPSYSAAWKLLGKALSRCNRTAEARKAYSSGIEKAEMCGDIQAAKEMRVFLKRLEKAPRSRRDR